MSGSHGNRYATVSGSHGNRYATDTRHSGRATGSRIAQGGAHGGQPHGRYSVREQIALYRRYGQYLPALEREALRLYIMEGYTYLEISSALGRDGLTRAATGTRHDLSRVLTTARDMLAGMSIFHQALLDEYAEGDVSLAVPSDVVVVEGEIIAEETDGGTTGGT